MRLLISFDCIDCGEPTTRYRHPHQPRVCLECGVARAVDAAIELAQAKANNWQGPTKYSKHLFQRGGRRVGTKPRKRGVT